MFANLLFSSVLATPIINNPPVDDSFVKIVSQNNWHDQIRKFKSGFLLFHAPYQRVSDMGYLAFLEEARPYKNRTNFFVIPAADADMIAREYAIGGFPSLYYVDNEKPVSELLGAFSKDNLRRFIANFTTSPIRFIAEQSFDSKDDLLRSLRENNYDNRPHLLILGNNETRFGRSAIQYATGHRSAVDFVVLTDPSFATLFDVRYPSIVYYREEDRKEFVYTGEPSVDSIAKWVNRLPDTRVSELQQDKLFGVEGANVYSVLALVERDDFAENTKTIQRLESAVKDFPRIKGFYADRSEHRAFLRTIGFESGMICIKTNYTFISYAKCDEESDVKAFASGSLELVEKRTPIGLFGGLIRVTENAFSDFSKTGSLFAAFTLSGDRPSAEISDYIAFIADVTTLVGSQAVWALWDVKNAVPTFREKLDLQVPSIWYFPSSNLTEGIKYDGKIDLLPILEWAGKVAPDQIEISRALEYVGGDQYDSL